MFYERICLCNIILEFDFSEAGHNLLSGSTSDNIQGFAALLENPTVIAK